MENWKQEINRLDKIRLDLGLNWYKLQILTGINRQQLQRCFELVNEPKLGFYLEIKSALENQIEVNPKPKKVSVPKAKNPPPKPTKKEVVSKNDCDCYMSGTLFLRGKSGCKKAKDEHKF